MKHSYSRSWIAALPLALGIATPALALAEEAAKDEPTVAAAEPAAAEPAASEAPAVEAPEHAAVEAAPEHAAVEAAPEHGAIEAAPEHGARDEHSGAESEHEEEEEGRNVISLKLAGLELVVPGVEGGGPVTDVEAEPEEGDEVLRRVGVSIGVERVLIAGWLDAELSVLFAPGPNGLTLPIDLVLKKPFEISHSLEAFVGAGLATEWFEDGEAETAYGLSTTLGGYYWLDPHIAIVLDGEYNLLLHPETAHEFVLASGAAVRF